MMLTAVGLISVIAVSWWLVEPVVQFLIPAYAEAGPAMKWGLLLPFVNSFYPMSSIFQIVRRQDLYGVALVLGMAIYVGIQMWLIQDTVSLVAFPQAMLVGRAVFAILCAGFVAYLCYEERHRPVIAALGTHKDRK